MVPRNRASLGCHVGGYSSPFSSTVVAERSAAIGHTYNQSHHPDEDAAVYLLDPIALNKISGINQIFSVPQDEPRFSYTKIYWAHNPFAAQAPIAIEPIFYQRENVSAAENVHGAPR